MARIRTIKPDFFRNYKLYKAEIEDKLPLRVAFAGLWTACDREGRFKWEPETLKLDCLPFDSVDFGKVMDALCKRGYIIKYTVEGKVYGCVPTFLKHQCPNTREAQSTIPPINQDDILTHDCTVHAFENNMHAQDGKGREGKGKEQEREGCVVKAIIYPFNTENFKKWWNYWKEYKRKEHKFHYKSEISEQAALKELANMAGGDEQKVIKIIEYTIAHSWKGFVDPDEKQFNGRAVNNRVSDSYKQQVMNEING